MRAAKLPKSEYAPNHPFSYWFVKREGKINPTHPVVCKTQAPPIPSLWDAAGNRKSLDCRIYHQLPARSWDAQLKHPKLRVGASDTQLCTVQRSSMSLIRDWHFSFFPMTGHVFAEYLNLPSFNISG